MQPLFAPKQTFARIDYLRQGGRLVDRKGAHNVKILAENQTKLFILHTRTRATWWKARTLMDANEGGCRACCSWPTEPASCKGRSSLELAASTQLVEKALNVFRLVAVWGITTFCHRHMGQNLGFYRIFVQYFVHERGVCLGLASQR